MQVCAPSKLHFTEFSINETFRFRIKQTLSVVQLQQSDYYIFSSSGCACDKKHYVFAPANNNVAHHLTKRHLLGWIIQKNALIWSGSSISQHAIQPNTTSDKT